jgi:hypothetical protein
MDAAELSHQLRTSGHEHLRRRRTIVACSLGAAASMGVISLFQMGVIRHLPEPPLPNVDADGVDASAEAYARLSTPDAVLGFASYAGACRDGRPRPRAGAALAAARARRQSHCGLSASREAPRGSVDGAPRLLHVVPCCREAHLCFLPPEPFRSSSGTENVERLNRIDPQRWTPALRAAGGMAARP